MLESFWSARISASANGFFGAGALTIKLTVIPMNLVKWRFSFLNLLLTSKMITVVLGLRQPLSINLKN